MSDRPNDHSLGDTIVRSDDTNPFGTPATILLVEDNPGDVRLMKETFVDARISNSMNVVTTGKEALDFVHQQDEFSHVSRPDVVLFDMHLLDLQSKEVLAELKRDPKLERIPVIAMTGSDSETEIVKSHEFRADAYLTKPIDPGEFIEVIRSFGSLRLTFVRAEN